MKKIVVLGASPDPERYAYQAVISLVKLNYLVFPLGIRPGFIGNLPIITDKPVIEDVDTLLLYLRPERQKEWLDYIVMRKPKRIIFNPGTENPELIKRCKENDLDMVFGCTLVMICLGRF